jgi:hypothetical protein
MMTSASHKVSSFKGVLHDKSPYALTFFDKYPDSPSALPQDVFNAAYDSTDPPIHRHVHRYETLARHVPLRKSSKLLKPVAQPCVDTDPQQMMAAMLNMVREGRLPIGAGAMDANIPITYMQHGNRTPHDKGRGAATWDDTWHARRHVPALCAPPAELPASSPPHGSFHDSASAASAALQFKPVPRHAAILDGAVGDTAAPSPIVAAETLHAKRECAAALPGEATTVQFGDANVHAPTPTEARVTSGDIEDEAFTRLRAKADKRKQDAAVAAKKRPAAAVSMTPAPAGKVIKLDVGMKWDKKCTLNQNAFSCRYYGRAKTQLKAMGANPDDMKVTLTHVSKLAIDLWQKHNK